MSDVTAAKISTTLVYVIAAAARGPSAGGLLGAQRVPPVPMERASSSNSGHMLSTTPMNFPGMHAVRRSSDLASTLDEAPPLRED